jgi:hypothetical protein
MGSLTVSSACHPALRHQSIPSIYREGPRIHVFHGATSDSPGIRGRSYCIYHCGLLFRPCRQTGSFRDSVHVNNAGRVHIVSLISVTSWIPHG